MSPFSTRRICSREQRKKQVDWLATDTDDIAIQSHSPLACSREKNRQEENGLKRMRVKSSQAILLANTHFKYIYVFLICYACSPEAALDEFAMRRFYDDKLGGVTQPSQRRYYSSIKYTILLPFVFSYSEWMISAID